MSTSNSDLKLLKKFTIGSVLDLFNGKQIIFVIKRIILRQENEIKEMKKKISILQNQIEQLKVNNY